MTRGAIAAVDGAAADDRLMPWPVRIADHRRQCLHVGAGEQCGQEIFISAQDQREDKGGDHAGAANRSSSEALLPVCESGPRQFRL